MDIKLIGQTIKVVRLMTVKELREQMWDDRDQVTAIVLSNGVTLFASRDEEGNGAGCIFGKTKDGKQFSLD